VKLQYLLDTNIVSEPALQRPSPKVLARLKTESSACAIAAPVWHELTYGVRRLPRSKRREELEAYLTEVVQRSFPIIPYDETAAAWHGAERARLEKLGKPAPFVDGQIAAIAFVNGLTLVTGNVKDFRRFKGVGVKTWR
jgi:tRNA(fMet)-specific endonuclease VapC